MAGLAGQQETIWLQQIQYVRGHFSFYVKKQAQSLEFSTQFITWCKKKKKGLLLLILRQTSSVHTRLYLNVH